VDGVYGAGVNAIEEDVCELWVDHVCGVRDGVCVHWMDNVCVQWTDEFPKFNLYDLGIPPYSGHDPVGNYEKNVAVVVNLQHIDMDLSFFQDKFNGDGYSDGDGVECFTGAPRPEGQTVLSIEHEKVKGKAKGALKAVYVFGGYGTDGTSQVGYRLKLSSEVPQYDSDWRPTVTNGRSDVTFDQWELSSQTDIACTGSGVLNTTISIIKTN